MSQSAKNASLTFRRVLDKTGSALLVARNHLRDGWRARKAYVEEKLSHRKRDDNSHTGV